jgi:glycosyltransferase involved in cell wall biosynthesis
MRWQCVHAAAISYVTERTLQKRYPAAPGAVTATYSSVDLPADAFVAGPRAPTGRTGPALLVSVGSLEQPYKGIDTLITAVARLTRADVPVRMVHVGDGRYRSQLERLAERLGVADAVDLVGRIPPGAAVRVHLDAADLFVMPSRTEGLPRALIEAMARGLPAIGTGVGGIPELLAPEDLVAPDDPACLAEALRAILADPRRLVAASMRNLYRARDFAVDSLAARRRAYYRSVRALTDRVPPTLAPSGTGVR